MAVIPLPPLNVEGVFLYGMMAFGLAVGFAIAVPIGERLQSNVAGASSAGMKR
jgi:hypothetical protein